MIKNNTGVSMDLISLLGKSYVRKILWALYKHGPLHVRAIMRASGCPGGTLTLRLKELEEAGIIASSVKEGGPGLPQRVCKLTDFGKQVVILCKEFERLEKSLLLSKIAVGNTPTSKSKEGKCNNRSQR